MLQNKRSILQLLDHIVVDRFYVVCHFRCQESNKVVVSTVPFEPYSGKIEFTWKDILFHPIESYNRYYHTPITIYGNNCNESVVLKAFEKVSEYFVYNSEKQQYIYN
jgi:hypothetical protein